MLGAFLRLLVLLAGGIILAQLASLGIMMASGHEIENANLNGLSANTLRTILLTGHLLTFILPCLLFIYLNYKDDKWKITRLDQTVSLNLFLLCVLFCVVSYPAVTYSYTVNSYIPLAEWMIGQEQSTAATLEKILTMDSLGLFVFNIILIALIPAIGEELLFRGLIMDFLERSIKNAHWAVWISAAAFSLFHLQFQGFLPRLLLGALLGYSFLFTRSLWVPILLHFLNNAAPIASLYFINEDLASIDPSDTPELHWSVGMVSAILGILVGYYIYTRYRKHEA
ncbi:CPBP family intramembrane glutamic endopeptidase [Portibacter marinus]|uniref:CPBP family intramembrane glutamic endopeptidase n=1 Tax=Portibacter marinus TaxID=2898660 RepID=UPI001F2203C4|nr:type II CAAX endopeptidase family protein [Portibacter marinus]